RTPNRATIPPMIDTNTPGIHNFDANSSGPVTTPATTSAQVNGAKNQKMTGARRSSRCSLPYEDPSTNASPTHGVNTHMVASAAATTAATPIPSTPAFTVATATVASPAGTMIRTTVRALLRSRRSAPKPIAQLSQTATK